MDTKTEYTESASILIDLFFGHAKFEILCTAMELGVFDALLKGGAICRQLAEKCDVPEYNFEKLLNALCALKLLKKTRTEKILRLAIYENSDIAKEYLTTSSNMSLKNLIPFYNLCKDMKMVDSIKKGGQVITKEKNIFSMSENKAQFRKVFQAGMACIAQTSHSLVSAFDLGQFRTLVDLGGSTGTFARKVADVYPELDVFVCDLPQVITLAVSLPENKHSRVKFVPGDFFKGDFPVADVYSLCHVLHDWDDDNCDVILKNVYKNLNPGGAILVLDSVFYDDKVGPIRINLTEMLQIVQHEGKHRTASEFENMLARHGFKGMKIIRHPGFVFYEVILAWKQ